MWHYRFMVDGRSFHGSTKETSKARAQQFENVVMARVHEGSLENAWRKSPSLDTFATQFLSTCELQVKAGSMARDSARYYANGVRLLREHYPLLMKRRVRDIATRDADVLTFPGSNSNANNALRTLRRLLGIAYEDGILQRLVKIHEREEQGRQLLIEPWIEQRLMAHAAEPLRSILVIMADTGMRPGEVMRLQWADVLLNRGAIRISRSKTSKRTKKARFVAISERTRDVLTAQRNAGEWVFPSKRRPGSHRNTVAKQWRACVRKANTDPGPKLPTGLALYCGRHTYATDLLQESGNLSLVQGTLGHTSITTTTKYLHPGVSRGRFTHRCEKPPARYGNSES